jgi:RNA polymerase sigma-70 factor, ECF subfamily
MNSSNFVGKVDVEFEMYYGRPSDRLAGSARSRQRNDVPVWHFEQFVGDIAVDHANTPADEAEGSDFVRLFTLHQLDIYLYVRSLILDLNEVAEIVQETNLALWEKREQFEAGRDFRAWAFQFARNKLLQHRDQHKRKCVCFSAVLIDELAIQAPQYANADNDLIDGLRRCIAELAAWDRDLLSQRYTSLATCESIAKAIGRPVRWVYKALSRIRRELLECMTRCANTWREP